MKLNSTKLCMESVISEFLDFPKTILMEVFQTIHFRHYKPSLFKRAFKHSYCENDDKNTLHGLCLWELYRVTGKEAYETCDIIIRTGMTTPYKLVLKASISFRTSRCCSVDSSNP